MYELTIVIFIIFTSYLSAHDAHDTASKLLQIGEYIPHSQLQGFFPKIIKCTVSYKVHDIQCNTTLYMYHGKCLILKAMIQPFLEKMYDIKCNDTHNLLKSD